MLSKDQLDIIREIQLLQESLENGMDSRLPEIFRSLSDQVIELTNEMSFDPKKKAETLKGLIALKKEISNTIIANVAYQAEVANVLNGFKELKKLSDSYFSSIIDGFDNKPELYKAILEVNIKSTKDLLLGSGIRDNFGNAINEVLKANATGTTNRTQLNKVLRQFIEGSAEQKPFLNRYIKQTTGDAIMTFSREYNATIADDLNLQYYFYQGTVISDSRQFCVARAGRYFKKKDVENWANLGDWNGRKAGTTRVTIFSFCGGWGCRHELYPVTKQQFLVAEKAGRAGSK